MLGYYYYANVGKMFNNNYSLRGYYISRPLLIVLHEVNSDGLMSIIKRGLLYRGLRYVSVNENSRFSTIYKLFG